MESTFRTWEQLSRREQLLCEASDIGKDAMGIRPRWIANYSESELEAFIESCRADIRQQIADEENAKAARIAQKRADSQKTALARKIAMNRKPWKVGHFFADVLAQVKVA